MHTKQSKVGVTHKHSWLAPLALQASSHPTMSRNLRRSGCRSSWSDLYWPRTRRSRRWSACSRWSAPVPSQCQNLWCGWPDRREQRVTHRKTVHFCLFARGSSSSYHTILHDIASLQLGLWLNRHNNRSGVVCLLQECVVNISDMKSTGSTLIQH